jgi:hypothetical protein
MEHAIGPDTGRGCPALFILGAPRTGSTVFFQALVEAFRLPYLSNLINDYFFETPALGLVIQAGIGKAPQIELTSHYGKTAGLLQPSEASQVMTTWFGGGHPSQLVSTRILPGRLPRLRDTLRAAHALFARPLAIKNAWNCFRLEELARLLPEALFIWIRRDIGAAAKSDLHARYATKDSPTEWNSATPHNVDALRSRPYCEQVVENQFEFNTAIERDLRAHAQGRFCEFWYEDFCADSSGVLCEIARTWPSLGPVADLGPRHAEIQRSAERWPLPGRDGDNIDDYLRSQAERFCAMRYDARSAVRKKCVTPIKHAGWHLRRVTPGSLDSYLRKDWVAEWLTANSRPNDQSLTSQRWLVDSPAKRHIYADLYGDLLGSSGRRIMDVGAGLSAFSRELAARHKYEVVELLAHEQADQSTTSRLGTSIFHHCDWLDLQPLGQYDVIVANDLFPNVDQRLELFLKKFLPLCRELRMSLTVFDAPRYYRTRRTDADEILFMMAWTWEQLSAAIERVGGRDVASQLRVIATPSPSVFPNGRQVVLLTVRE